MVLAPQAFRLISDVRASIPRGRPGGLPRTLEAVGSMNHVARVPLEHPPFVPIPRGGTRQHKIQGTSSFTWLLRQLRAMPDSDNPHRRVSDAIKEAVGGHHDLTIGQFGELWDDSA